MIHAYNDEFLPTVQSKLATMTELAVLKENVEIDAFFKAFLISPVCSAFETADPILTFGKSASELLGVVLQIEPHEAEINCFASPEYWTGYTLAYAQWYFNKPYAELIAAYPCSKLICNYFPYHEMDITQSLDLFRSKLNLECRLKVLRLEKNLSQSQLSLLSGVPIRTIKSYEQGKVDIAKAQGETLFALSRVLNCSIEDLIY